MKTTTIRRSLGALALWLAAAGLGNANTLTYYVDVFGLGTATTTPIAPSSSTLAAAGTIATISIPKLDQLNGPPAPPAGFIWQLTQVALKMDWRSQAEFQVVNISTTNYTFSNGFTFVPIQLTGPDGTQNNVTASAGPASGTALGLPSPQPTAFPGQVGSGTNTQHASNLAPYQGFGGGSYNVDVETGAFSATGSGQTGSSGKLFYGGDGMAGAILSVTYTYDAVQAVPEPATSSVLGAALIGLGTLIYRKRSKK